MTSSSNASTDLIITTLTESFKEEKEKQKDKTGDKLSVQQQEENSRIGQLKKTEEFSAFFKLNNIIRAILGDAGRIASSNKADRILENISSELIIAQELLVQSNSNEPIHFPQVVASRKNWFKKELEEMRKELKAAKKEEEKSGVRNLHEERIIFYIYDALEKDVKKLKNNLNQQIGGKISELQEPSKSLQNDLPEQKKDPKKQANIDLIEIATKTKQLEVLKDKLGEKAPLMRQHARRRHEPAYNDFLVTVEKAKQSLWGYALDFMAIYLPETQESTKLLENITSELVKDFNYMPDWNTVDSKISPPQNCSEIETETYSKHIFIFNVIKQTFENIDSVSKKISDQKSLPETGIIAIRELLMKTECQIHTGNFLLQQIKYKNEDSKEPPPTKNNIGLIAKKEELKSFHLTTLDEAIAKSDIAANSRKLLSTINVFHEKTRKVLNNALRTKDFFTRMFVNASNLHENESIAVSLGLQTINIKDINDDEQSKKTALNLYKSFVEAESNLKKRGWFELKILDRQASALLSGIADTKKYIETELAGKYPAVKKALQTYQQEKNHSATPVIA